MSSLPSSPRSPQSTDISSLLAGKLPQDGVEEGSSALLGQRLVRKGHLSQGQLTQALREQQQNRLRLGEICLDHEWISQEVLYSELSTHTVMLGELLIASQELTFDQLRVALAQQRRFGRQLGEILVWKGWVTPERLQQMLEVQQQLRGSPAYSAWEMMQELGDDLDPEEPLPSPAAEEEVPFSTPLSRLELPDAEIGESDLNPFAAPVAEESEESLAALAEVFPELGPGPTPPQAEEPGWLAGDDPPSSLTPDPQQQRIAELEQQLRQRDQDWDGMVAEMNRQIETYQQQYQTRISKLELKIREQQGQLHQVQQNETTVGTSNHEREQLQAQLQQARDQVEQQQDQIQVLRQMVEEFKKQAEEAEHQLSHRQQHPSEAAPESSSQLHALQLEVDQLQQQLAFAQSATVQQKIHSQQLQQEVERMQSQRPESQQQLHQAQERIRELEAEAAQTQQVVANLQQQLQDHPQTTPDSSSQTEELGRRLEDLEQAHQHYEILIEKQQTQLEAAQTRVTQLTQELEETRTQLREVNEALHSKQTQADQASRHLSALQLQLDQAQKNRAELAQELQHSQTLLESYRQQFASMESSGASPTVAPQSSHSSSPPQMEKKESDDRDQKSPSPQVSAVMPMLTTRAQNLFFQLQEAGLLSDAQMDQVLITWQQRGGKLTQVLSDCTGLTPKTVTFFSDGGYSARVSGYERIGEFLKAADLVTEAQIKEVISKRPSDQPLVQALVDQGLLNPVTADYFIRHFVQPI